MPGTVGESDQERYLMGKTGYGRKALKTPVTALLLPYVNSIN
jgi:hypothetical protein